MNNSFRSPAFTEETIVDESGLVVGHIRLKPSGILWKPKGNGKYYSVPIDKFEDWITDPKTKASRAAR